MKDRVISKQKSHTSSNSLLALKLTKIFILIFSVGIFVVGRRETTWPIITWILYSGYSDRFRSPKPSVSAVELRVYTATGERYTVKPERILSLPYDSLSHSIVAKAFDDTDIEVRDASRNYLINAVSRFLDTDSEIQTIEAWEISYEVEPLKVPPLHKENPTQKIMLGNFSLQDEVNASPVL